MSDQTIALGQILDAVPDAILVLKANASRIFIRRILRRRMITHGLDPNRVEWLLTQGPLEHLKQYSRLDVAPDPYPNGGTTTFGLLMGVPVIL